jgi:subtilisin family serine protease/subtilisin-like proprotein convertase family protein
MRRIHASDLLDTNYQLDPSSADWTGWLNDGWSGVGAEFALAAAQFGTQSSSAGLSSHLSADHVSPGLDMAPGLGEGAESFAKRGSGSGSPGPSPSPSPSPPSSSTVIKSVTVEPPALHPPIGIATLPTDTYFSQQWNLTSATAGIDVVKAWQNYTGAGVKIGIVDDGIDYNHPDLAPHYLFNLQYDAVTADGSAYGNPSTDNHGTTVAGVLAAADNGVGIVGVAFNAGFAGDRIGYGSNGNTSQYADALNHLLTSGFDVANNSWGYATPFQDNFNSYWSSSKSAILNDITNGRGGLGIDIVFAAGNNRSAGDNVDYHNYQNDPYVITVAATDNNGHVASFSNPGAALLVSAPGSYDISDDRLGAYGWSSGDYVGVAGTSYAAPTVSGVIALMLEANPNLGYRDVQEILAESARNSDPSNAGWMVNGVHDWNGGGMHFSPDYGFGLVDATAAVRLAESWQKQSTFADMSTETVVHTDSLAIADGGGVTQSQITFTTSLTLDKAVIDLNIGESSVSDLSVWLTSPDGTTAQLVSHPTAGTGGGIVFEMSANNFMGEDALGTWTLNVADTVANGSSGNLNGWTLEGMGDAASTAPDYVYTDEFATMSGGTRTVLNDASGAAMINTAAVTTGSLLDLHAGAFDTIAGRTLQIGSTTTIKSAWAGDGNDTIIANDAGDVIQGGRGNDTIVTGHGADLISGGPGSDLFQFNFLKSVASTITDFTIGNDVVDMRQLFGSIGYTGTDPLADKWLSLTADASGTGTDFVIDPHNASAPVVVADLLHIAPTALHQGTDYWLV